MKITEKSEAYGVDLDGTLAEYHGWTGDRSVGKAIPKMLSKVKQWIEEGTRVVIFTARAEDPENIPPIVEWLEYNGIGGLEITNMKTPDISRIYDDRAIQVKRNEGDILGDESLMIEWKTRLGPGIKLNELYNRED
jgi:hypothetical protein